MWRRFLQWVADRRPTRTYDVEGRPLFHRTYLFGGRTWVVFLRHYMRSDPERGVYDHPARCAGMVLAGGYEDVYLRGIGREGIDYGVRRRRPFVPFWFDEHRFHKVRLDWSPGWPGKEDCTNWSLFLVRYLDKEWGFVESRTTTTRSGRQATLTYTPHGRGNINENRW